MKLKRIKPKICFALGLAGCISYAIAGVLLFLRTGEATLPRTVGFALIGGMILFLATTQRGTENKGKRLVLLLFFFFWLLSYLNLPPLSNLAGAIVLPLVAWRYRTAKSVPWLLVLLAAEIAYAVATFVNIIHTEMVEGQLYITASYPVQLVGGLLVLVSLARGAVLFRLYRQAAKTPEAEEDVVHRLR